MVIVLLVKNDKTNAMRLLDAAKVEYETFEYDAEKYVSGKEVASALNEDPEQVFKTLVTYSEKNMEHFVFCIPVENELDLKKASKAVNVKDIEMIKQKELLPLTGYVHGGCSPIGMKKSFNTVIDESAILFDEIMVSAGRRGMQIKIKLDDLIRMTKAELKDVVKQ